MPTFDIVSKLDMQEVDNTINMVSRDILNRYDFKGSSAKLTLNKTEKTIKLEADNHMQLTAVRDMLENRAISRNLSIKIFNYQSEENASGMSIRQIVMLREGINRDNAKEYIQLLLRIMHISKQSSATKLDVIISRLSKKLSVSIIANRPLGGGGYCL